MRIVLVLLLLVLGCGPSQAELRRQESTNTMNSWLGATRDQVIRAWGVPSQEAPLNDGGTILLYHSGGGQAFVPLMGTIVGVPISCDRTFIFGPDLRVVNWRTRGNC